jgi:hypothetical protein
MSTRHQWVLDPGSGGKKIPQEEQQDIEKRTRA